MATGETVNLITTNVHVHVAIKFAVNILLSYYAKVGGELEP